MDTIVLVPQGAEYQAVRRGLDQASSMAVLAIPIGVDPVTQWLQTQEIKADRILVMGLCGALAPELDAGDAVVYASCQSPGGDVWSMREGFEGLGQIVRGVTSDRILATAQDKRAFAHLGDVVDMEGIAIARAFPDRVMMLRVVSDSADQDLPDLSGAISPEGKLLAWPMAKAMIKQPQLSLGLIRGSLGALKMLEKLAQRLG
jgi:nucleoside phosphorylase